MDIKESSKIIEGSLAGANMPIEPSISGGVSASFINFQKDPKANFELAVKGETAGENYTAEKLYFDKNVQAEKAKESVAKLNDTIKEQEVIANSADDKEFNRSKEELLSVAYNMMSEGKFADFLRGYQSKVMFNNSVDAPTGMGGIEFVMPSLIKMLGKMYQQNATIGTMTRRDGSSKTFTIADYITEENRSDLGYTPYLGYGLQKQQTMFTSYKDIRNAVSNRPGAQKPNNMNGNSELAMDFRSVKTYAFDMSLSYNLMEVQALSGYYGLDIVANKVNNAYDSSRWFWHYSGLDQLWYNPAFKVEKVSKTQANTNTYLCKNLGLLDETGKAIISLSTIQNQAGVVIENFARALKTISESGFGNNTMEDPCLLVPKAVFDAWNTRMYPNYLKQGPMVGYASFVDYLQANVGITVLPSIELDEFAKGKHGFSLLADANEPDGTECFAFYDRAQFNRIITKTFNQFNGSWGTADGVTMTTIFNGQLTEVYNPYFKEGMNPDNTEIPAWKVKIYPGNIPA